MKLAAFIKVKIRYFEYQNWIYVSISLFSRDASPDKTRCWAKDSALGPWTRVDSNGEIIRTCPCFADFSYLYVANYIYPKSRQTSDTCACCEDGVNAKLCYHGDWCVSGLQTSNYQLPGEECAYTTTTASY